jgi:hypothetical protein
MIKLFSTPAPGVNNQSSLASSESLSSAKSLKIRGDRAGLEHISEVLPRILAVLDREQLGKISEQGGGHQHSSSPQKNEIAPLLVTTSYPEGGVAQAERSVLSHRDSIHHGS